MLVLPDDEDQDDQETPSPEQRKALDIVKMLKRNVPLAKRTD